jgi:glucose-1-phosphate thymidylyltransferase
MITGCAGFIGANFTKYWLNNYTEDTVIGVDCLTYAANLPALTELKLHDKFNFYKTNICDRQAVEKIFQNEAPDIVINFAAESHVDRSIADSRIFVETNILGTQTLLDLCLQYGAKRFHQISTDEVYGDLPLDTDDVFTEDSPLKPSFPYSASKAAADMLVLSYFRTHGLSVSISRSANNYGKYQHTEKLIPKVSLILAAGYATRLYPLTENFPKPLLMIGTKTIIDWLIDDINTSKIVNEYIVVTNHKFAPYFLDWAKHSKENITVVDDGTTTNETRLGAVKDTLFAIETLQIEDDVMVIAGDNVLDFSLTKFIAYAQEKNTSCIMRYFEPDKSKLLKCGVVTVDNSDKILHMTEKSDTPATHWCCPPFYYYRQSDIKLIRCALKDGCPADAPGSFFAWLSKKVSTHAMEIQ